MEKLAEAGELQTSRSALMLPLSVIVPVKDEAHNLVRCLESLREVGEVYVIDSQSTDATAEVARGYGAKVVQFHYHGGWPKKRQWAMDTLPFAHDWIFLVDADEAMTPELANEIRLAIQDSRFTGYYIKLQNYFLGRPLRHSAASFYKLSLFRHGKGRFECRLKDQDSSMADMEVHEHVIVDGATAKLKNPLLHHNVESLSRYIRKHDEYSNWDARVWMQGEAGSGELPPALFGTQAQRRRWLRKKFLSVPGSPLAYFLFKYVLCLGFLDGVPGLIYCCFHGVQFFHIKAKMYELSVKRENSPGNTSNT